MSGILYLFPVTLSECSPEKVLPTWNLSLLSETRHFIVEDIRSARRFLRKAVPELVIDDCHFFLLNEHTHPSELSTLLEPLKEGYNMGLLSEAGCPAVADPGADLVRAAHQQGYRVVPLVGPSSILLSLMASGFNGQRFAFEGYLPIEQEKRQQVLKSMEQQAMRTDTTFIFIETPYRNNKLLKDMIACLRPQTPVCIAFDLTGPAESIETKPLSGWKKQLPDLSGKPCIFLLYRP
jgi:16S rRNA (cytidine1402-2'-O)-methyltransferase